MHWLSNIVCKTIVINTEHHARTQIWRQGYRTPIRWKITKLYGSLAILFRVPGTSQSYQTSIQCCWAIIGPPAKRHLNERFAGEPNMARF